MSTPQPQINTFILPERKSESDGSYNFLSKYLYHWPLFLICILIAVAGLLIYLPTFKLHYPIKATLLIKDESKSPDQKSALHEIDLSNSENLIENEIEILKSNQLISQVVKDLRLNITYDHKTGTFSHEDLYSSSPIKLVFVDSTENYKNAVLNIRIKDANSFFLVQPNGNQQTAKYNTSYQSSFGIWKLLPTKFIPEFKNENISISINDPDKIALQYQSAIDVSLSNKLATAVVVTLNDQIPQRGKDVLNRLISKYNMISVAEKNRETKTTMDFLDQRIASLSGELATAEKGIEDFKSSRGLTDLTSDAKISLENQQSNDTRLNEVNVQLSVINGIEKYINSPGSGAKIPAMVGISDPALTSSIETLAKLQLQRDRLLTTTPETNPDFEAIDSQIQTTRNAIKTNIANLKASLVNAQQKLQTYNTKFESSIKNVPTQEREFLSMKRQQEIKENLYSYLLQKREEISVNYASTIADDRVVDHAYAGTPKNQQRMIAYALAMFLSLGLPVGFIYGRDVLNNRITALHEIKDALKIPVIGELPFENAITGIVINDTTITAISEQIRALRTKIHYLYGDKEKGRVTLVTSSVPGEGKSFVCSNLGAAFAYAGRKTVILEIDLRKPQIAKTFNLSNNHAGISDFLKGKASINEIIQQSGINENLQIISSGSKITNPSELLEIDLFKELIAILKETYDDILIDSPPVHLVPDAMILSRLTDLTLYTIRQGTTGKGELKFIKELNEQKQLTNMNLVFNGIERSKYGYGYKYNGKYYDQDRKNNVLKLIFGNFLNRF